MVGIILYGPFELAPYAKAYMQMLDGMDIKYDLIGWRRGDAAEYEGENVYIYCGKTAKRFSTPIHKLLPTVKYRRFVKRLIRKKKYDMLIILTTQTAMILPDVLLGRYSGRYIFDYRDKSYEYIKLYRALVNAFARHSKETAVSSPWFAENLTDKKKYVTVHNFRDELLHLSKPQCKKKSAEEKIVVGYIGVLRQYEYHRWLCDIFGGDGRFEFHTYGCGDDEEKLEEYAKKYKNVFVHGAYREDEKYEITDTFDMMCYNYPYSFVNDGAVANKYYDSLILKKPMLVNPKTLVGRFIADEGMGVGITEEEQNIADRIYSWYRGFDPAEFSAVCDKYMEKYAQDNRRFVKVMSKALENGENKPAAER